MEIKTLEDVRIWYARWEERAKGNAKWCAQIEADMKLFGDRLGVLERRVLWIIGIAAGVSVALSNASKLLHLLK